MKQKFVITYRDQWILAVSKPPGLLTTPDRYDRTIPSLSELLANFSPDPFVVHRLDRETSGVVLFALDADSHRDLSIQFESRKVTKVYQALVAGVVDWDEKLVDLLLRANADRKHRTHVDLRGGKPAETSFRVSERFDNFTLVDAVPRTGRTHQIRVHLQSCGHPLVADSLYGSGEPLLLSSFKRNYRRGKHDERPLIARTALHSRSISFSHPRTGEPMRLEAPMARDMAATLNQLAKHGRLLPDRHENAHHG